MVAVRIADIKGLYLPGSPDSSAPPGATRAAGYSPGYKSLDDQGRIYINRDLDGEWARNTQLIEITVEVTGLGLEGELPDDARIRWSARDPDDPFNERPEVHPDWAPTLDENDYDASGNYVAPAGEDNEGTTDSRPGWEEVEGYPLSDATETSASTAIAGMRSTIRRRMTDVAGDNVIVRAELEGVAEAAGDETGIGYSGIGYKTADVMMDRVTKAVTIGRSLADFEKAVAPQAVAQKKSNREAELRSIVEAERGFARASVEPRRHGPLRRPRHCRLPVSPAEVDGRTLYKLCALVHRLGGQRQRQRQWRWQWRWRRQRR